MAGNGSVNLKLCGASHAFRWALYSEVSLLGFFDALIAFLRVVGETPISWDICLNCLPWLPNLRTSWRW
jgi:hypothetical protein